MADSSKHRQCDFLSFEDQLDSTQKETIQSVRRFVQAEAEPIIQKAFRNETFPKQLVPQMGNLGILTIQ